MRQCAELGVRLGSPFGESQSGGQSRAERLSLSQKKVLVENASSLRECGIRRRRERGKEVIRCGTRHSAAESESRIHVIRRGGAEKGRERCARKVVRE